MFHMISCFNLVPGESIGDFRRVLIEFVEHMQTKGLVSSCGPIGRRYEHPIMDTDSERNQQYYFVMTFNDRDQLERAVACLERREQPADSSHKAVFSRTEDGIFTCWKDI